MKLTLRPEWRLRPLTSFLGCLDIKTGVTIALLFALLNKVAGLYGLVATLTGAGGSAAQLSMYIYSMFGLVALVWGLKVVGQEDAKQTLYFAHLFFADHILSTAWTVYFAVVWWVYIPHDGRQEAKSGAQKEIQELGGGGLNMTEAERTSAAMELWHDEKGTAAAVIIAGWIIKIYFALLIYSYAFHLRKGSYRTLPHSRSQGTGNSPYASFSGLAEEEESEDLYTLPVRAPPPSSHSHTPSGSSFADFMTAPGRGVRKGNSMNKTQLRSKSALGSSNAKGFDRRDDAGSKSDEVLFDENEIPSDSGSGMGDSQDEDRVSRFGGDRSAGQSRRTSQVRS